MSVKCRILKVWRPGMSELFLPQYKGWFLWHNIPKHRSSNGRYTQYYFSIEEAEAGLKQYLAINSCLEAETVKEFDL